MRIVLAEDHRMFRDAVSKFCANELGAQVVGEAGTGRKAMALIAATKPDLVLLDLHLPDGDGFEVAEFTRTRWPSIRMLMLSAHCDDYTLFRVEKSGAHGFVEKNTQSLRTLRLAFEALRRGETFYTKAFNEAKTARASDPKSFAKVLSDRECSVLSLIGQSLGDEEIARRLGITPTTAQTHRSHIMRKLGLANSVKLAQYAIEHGFTRIISQRNGKPVLS
jgi:DNA-binding NarL/FixJ family response regulator